MGIPAVKVKKSGSGGSPATNANDGILAIIASAITGTVNLPGIFTDPGLLQAAYGNAGCLAEYATYDIEVSGNACLAMRGNASVTGTYGTITFAGTGTSAVTAGTTHPYEHYSNASVNIVTGCTVGSAGGTYTYTLDGVTTSPVQTIPTGTAPITLTIPNSGVSFSLGAGSLVTGDSWTFTTERPLLSNSDVSTSVAALAQTGLPWEGVLIDCQYTTGTLSLVDTWLTGLQASGKFKFALLNTRYLLEPTPTGESAATYSAAMITLTQNDASEQVCVGADGGHVASTINGWVIKRPTSLALGAKAMALTPNIGIDPSWPDGAGAVTGYQIDAGSNPNDWDEGVYQALDSQRLVTLRSFASGGPEGVYITNANVLIPNGSAIVYLQYLRVMNKACTIAWQVLTRQLGRGIDRVLNKATGDLNIDPRDAQALEGLVNPELDSGLAGQVTASACLVSRTDPLNSPTSPVNADVEIEGKFYIKGINVTVALVKTITVPQGGG